ncbi:MAG: efflux RND transporter periplasmic adaptor subunit [Candidatus Acidoferrales bacterium]
MTVRKTFCSFSGGLLALGLLLGLPECARAQEPPPGMGQGPSPVRYTEARRYEVRREIVLLGTVESRVTSVVASELGGLVMELSAREGDALKKGEPLARLRTLPLEIRQQAAEAQLKEAEAQLKLAELNLERARELLEARVISRQDYDDRYYTFNARLGRVEQLRAAIQGIKLDIERSTIRAPFDGVVYRERTEVGEWVGEGDPVVEMVAMDELEVRIEVPERYYRLLSRGTRARVSFDSLPGVEVSGRINALIPRADPQARTFPAKVRISSRGGRIGVGMLAQVSLAAGQRYQATVVPKDAVIRRGEREFVYLMNGDNTVSLVPVETGAAVGDWVAVDGEIREGQRVVTRGNERLRPGQLVAGQPQEYRLP